MKKQQFENLLRYELGWYMSISYTKPAALMASKRILSRTIQVHIMVNFLTYVKVRRMIPVQNYKKRSVLKCLQKENVER